jgi:ribosomal protein S24E
MEITVSKKVQNPLFNRLEVYANIQHSKEATPSRADVLKKIADIVDAKPELCVIRQMRTTYGSDFSTAILHAYDDEKNLKEFESEYLIKRTLIALGIIEKEKKVIKEKPKPPKPKEEEAPKEEPKKEEAKKEKPKEEKPKEEPKN